MLTGASFRPDIEGLRAIAILLVVAFHAGIPGFSGGYVGVDVFFVLSGYLITGLLVREIDQTGTVDLWSFYARRARRLLPALALMLLGTVIAGVLIYAPFEANRGGFGATAAATAAYASNLYFASWRTDYFGPDRENNPLLHTWSLSVEEQFYLVWPVLVMVGLGALSRSGKDRNRSRLLLFLAVAAGASFGLSLYLTRWRPSWAYFASPARAWEFAIGALALLIPQRPVRKRAVLGWLGLAGIAAAVVSFDRTTPFPGFAALLPALATAIALRAADDPQSKMARILGAAPLQTIGRLSYSWYLWHWPVLVFGLAIFTDPPLAGRIALVVAALGIAAASYRFVENPIRYSRRLAGRPAYSLIMAVVLTAIGLGLALTWRQVTFWAVDHTEHGRFARAFLDGPSIKCMGDYFTTEIEDCSSAHQNSNVSAVLFGDSHAGQWFSAVEPIAVKNGWRLVTMVKSACPTVEAEFYYPELGRIYSECTLWRRNAIEKIRQMRPILTLMAFSENYEFDDAEWREGLKNVLSEVSKSSRRVVLLRDTPAANLDVPACLARHAWRPRLIPSPACDFRLNQSPRVYDIQRSVADHFDNVFVVDLSSNICPDGFCRVERSGLILYRDSNHLTGTFVRSLMEALAGRLDPIL